MVRDVYTPWRESGAALRARLRGRDDELRAIEQTIAAWARGDRATPIYVFGQRGMGKSHLIALAVDAARAAGRPVRFLSEDVPATHTAALLLQRLANPGRHGAATSAALETDFSGLIAIDGLDNHLDAMSEQERRRFRGWLQESSALLIASGCTLPPSLTEQHTAFYGFFQPWPLRRLDDASAAALLDGEAAEAREAPRWAARRQALVELAGGSPRTLVALAGVCAAEPHGWASHDVLRVVQQFTAHYQLRLRDLPPQQQQILDALTFAPGPRTAGEVAADIGVPNTTVSTQCQRMAHDEVLSAQPGERPARYGIAEPMLRYWLEYRNAPWEEARVQILARLLQLLLDADEVVDLILGSTDPELREAAGLAAGEAPVALRQLGRELRRSDPARQLIELDPDLRERFLSYELDAGTAHTLCPTLARSEAALAGDWAWLHRLAVAVQSLQVAGRRKKASALEMFSRVAEAPERHRRAAASLATDAVHAAGRPWQLDDAERRRLAAIPFLRARFLVAGRTSSQPPVLDPRDLRDVPADAMTQDWPDLLGAALRDPARTLFYPLTCAPGAQFVAHRAPPVWSRDAEMLEHLLREAPACHPWLLLSWAAHFPDLSPEGWARMTARVRDTAAALTGGAPAALTVQALTILGARDRDALDRLERDAAIDDATLPRLCERARELVQARRLHRGYAELLAVTRAMGDTLPLL